MYLGLELKGTKTVPVGYGRRRRVLNTFDDQDLGRLFDEYDFTGFSRRTPHAAAPHAANAMSPGRCRPQRALDLRLHALALVDNYSSSRLTACVPTCHR